MLAETKDHHNWELIGRVAKNGGPFSKALMRAYEEVEQEGITSLITRLGGVANCGSIPWACRRFCLLPKR